MFILLKMVLLNLLIFSSLLLWQSSAFSLSPSSAPYDTRPLHVRSRTPVVRLSTRTFASSQSSANHCEHPASGSPTDIVGDVTFLISACEKASKFGKGSPVGNPSVAQAVTQLSNKVQWFANGRVKTTIVELSEDEAQMQMEGLEQEQALLETDVLIAMGLDSLHQIGLLQDIFEKRAKRDISLRSRQCHFALDCTQQLPPLVGPFREDEPSLQAKILPWTSDASALRLRERMQKAFDRWTTDDFCYAVVLFMNQFSGKQLDWVKHTTEATWEKGPIQNAKEFLTMVDKCQDCIQACVADDKCRECIGKLTEIDPRDQVQNYRTITSYESDLLRDFSLCILTKNNVFNCNAEIPTLPQVHPISMWRGKKLTVQDGKDILVGHLDDPSAPDGSMGLDTSWIVAAGANVAYDQFPSQNQIFYPQGSSTMWYDPVFRVETLDGRHVWCHRHYRVRPQKLPGTFRFSVLDNGVTSDEYWNIIGAADDLSWVCFHYAGAAAAVGQQYLGGLVCTPDGSMPKESELPVIWRCLRSAGIEPWELSVVNNDVKDPGAVAAGPPPLLFYRGKYTNESV